MAKIGRRIAVEQVQELIHQDLVVEHPESAADGSFAVAFGIPGKTEPGCKVQMATLERLRRLQRRQRRIEQEPHFVIDLGWYCGQLVTQPEVQRQTPRNTI